MGTNVGIVLAGGIGQRFGGDVPKQYRTVFGKEMIWYSIDAFRRAKKIDDFTVELEVNGPYPLLLNDLTDNY